MDLDDFAALFTPQISSKILRCALCFNLSSRYSVIPIETLSRAWYVNWRLFILSSALCLIMYCRIQCSSLVFSLISWNKKLQGVYLLWKISSSAGESVPPRSAWSWGKRINIRLSLMVVNYKLLCKSYNLPDQFRFWVDHHFKSIFIHRQVSWG